MNKFLFNVVFLCFLYNLMSCNTSAGNKLELTSAEINLYNYEIVDGELTTTGPFTFEENRATTFNDFVLVGIKFHVGYYYDGTNDQPIRNGCDGSEDNIENINAYWLDKESGNKELIPNFYLTSPTETEHLYTDLSDFINKYNSDETFFQNIDLSNELYFFLSLYKFGPRCDGCLVEKESTVIQMDFEFDNRSFSGIGKR